MNLSFCPWQPFFSVSLPLTKEEVKLVGRPDPSSSLEVDDQAWARLFPNHSSEEVVAALR